MLLAEGATLAGRYHLQRQVGEGGMATVWLATHDITHKVVAIKVLRPEVAVDPVARERFFREARATTAIRHPNIIEVHDVFELDDGIPAMVMEFLEGETLEAKRARHGGVFLHELVPILVHAAAGLAAAHAAGTIHRDVKPANIFLCKNSPVKVLDFGLALSPSIESPLTKTGQILGTPEYMSPEQLFGEKDIDLRTDIWSLGVVMFKCLTGRPPVASTKMGDVMRALHKGEVPRIEAIYPTLSPDIIKLTNQMLSIERDARPQSMQAVQHVLERYIDADALAATMPGTQVGMPPWVLERAKKSGN